MATSNEKAHGKSGVLTGCTIFPNRCVEHEHSSLVVSSPTNSLSFRSVYYSKLIRTATPIQKTALAATQQPPNEYQNGGKAPHWKPLQNYLEILRGFNHLRNQNQYTETQIGVVSISIPLEDYPSSCNNNLEFSLVSLVNINTLILLTLLTVVAGLFYEMVIITVPYARTESIIDITNIVQTKIDETIKWAHDQDLYAKLNPLLCGIGVAIFSIMLIYLDSDVPGISPPSPFSPLKNTKGRERRSALHLGYIIAITAGALVSTLMYFDFSSY